MSFRNLTLALVVLVSGSCVPESKTRSRSSEATSVKEPQDPVTIFNDKDLDDWKGVKDNWYVEDGMLVGSTMDGILDESSWMTTPNAYEDFELTMEVKLLGDENRNSGVYYRGEWDEEFVVGYEFDFGGWGEDDNAVWWGELHDPFRRDMDEFREGLSQEEVRKVYRPEEWNEVKIRAEGNRIQHWLNGRQTVDFRETDPRIGRSGFIAFQMHGDTAFKIFV